LHVRIARRDARQQRRHVDPAEGQRGADAQHAARHVAEIAHGQLGTLDGLQRPQRVLVEDFAGRRQAQAARRAFKQTHAEGLLQFADLLADLRPRAIQAPRRSRHAAGLDHLHETCPTVQPVHLSTIH